MRSQGKSRLKKEYKLDNKSVAKLIIQSYSSNYLEYKTYNSIVVS